MINRNTRCFFSFIPSLPTTPSAQYPHILYLFSAPHPSHMCVIALLPPSPPHMVCRYPQGIVPGIPFPPDRKSSDEEDDESFPTNKTNDEPNGGGDGDERGATKDTGAQDANPACDETKTTTVPIGGGGSSATSRPPSPPALADVDDKSAPLTSSELWSLGLLPMPPEATDLGLAHFRSDVTNTIALARKSLPQAAVSKALMAHLVDVQAYVEGDAVLAVADWRASSCEELENHAVAEATTSAAAAAAAAADDDDDDDYATADDEDEDEDDSGGADAAGGNKDGESAAKGGGESAAKGGGESGAARGGESGGGGGGKKSSDAWPIPLRVPGLVEVVHEDEPGVLRSWWGGTTVAVQVESSCDR
jgi:hypothetical protein